MQAKCPQCSAVFETSQLGLQFCPSCGQQVSITSAVGGGPPDRPALGGFTPGNVSGVPPTDQGPRGPTPWEQRRERGALRGLFETWMQSMFDPERFWAKVLPNAKAFDALSYAWILAGIYQVLQLPLRPLEIKQVEWLRNRFPGEIPPQLAELLDKAAQAGPGSWLSDLAFFLVAFPLVVLVMTAVTHLCCLLVGAAKYDFWATFRVNCYSFSPLVFCWIPCISVVAFFYIVIQGTIGIVRVHETSTGRGLVAVLLPVLVLCCCCVGLGALALTMGLGTLASGK